MSGAVSRRHLAHMGLRYWLFGSLLITIGLQKPGNSCRESGKHTACQFGRLANERGCWTSHVNIVDFTRPRTNAEREGRGMQLPVMSRKVGSRDSWRSNSELDLHLFSARTCHHSVALSSPLDTISFVGNVDGMSAIKILNHFMTRCLFSE